MAHYFIDGDNNPVSRTQFKVIADQIVSQTEKSDLEAIVDSPYKITDIDLFYIILC